MQIKAQEMSSDRFKGKRVVGLIREPFIEKIPSARILVEHLAAIEMEVTIVTGVNCSYPEPSFGNGKIRFLKVKENNRRWQLPTSLKLFFSALRSCFRTKPDFILGIGLYGGFIGLLISKLLKRPFVFSCIELPEKREAGVVLSYWQKLEYWLYRQADLVLVHDHFRAQFIVDQSKADGARFVVLPNTPGGKSRRVESEMLAEIFELDRKRDVILLHSGGFGAWFECDLLIQAAHDFPSNYHLVFHTNHDVTNTTFYQQHVANHLLPEGVHFSHQPVPVDQLDRLVSSAKIGIAFYSGEHLGHRRHYMGLASGKIGSLLKNGIPVITSDIPTLKEYVEGYGCGVCVRSPNELTSAVHTIMSDYDTYQANAIRCFDELWDADRYWPTLDEKLISLITRLDG
uniref:Uncharacterized protein n=1 Tax=Magnetococcus massalia (strain MO-1) TaxID=451514 RepID=A0A1S7LK73_MAGMO|nr:Protein of unknown function [Candidatus Magnetococcus massalia]